MEDAETYKKMLARDERRFRVADQDGDSMATREELTAFLHPEEFPHMRDIVVAVSEGRPASASLGSSGPLVPLAPSPGNPGHKGRLMEGDISHPTLTPQCHH